MEIKFQNIVDSNIIVITEVDGKETFQVVPIKIEPSSADYSLMFEEKAVKDYAVVFGLFLGDVLTSDKVDVVPCVLHDQKITKLDPKFEKLRKYVTDTWNFLYFEKIDSEWQLARASTQLKAFPYGKTKTIGFELEVPVKAPITDLERITSEIYRAMPTRYFCSKYNYDIPEEPFKDRISDIENFFKKDNAKPRHMKLITLAGY